MTFLKDRLSVSENYKVSYLHSVHATISKNIGGGRML